MLNTELFIARTACTDFRKSKSMCTYACACMQRLQSSHRLCVKLVSTRIFTHISYSRIKSPGVVLIKSCHRHCQRFTLSRDTRTGPTAMEAEMWFFFSGRGNSQRGQFRAATSITVVVYYYIIAAAGTPGTFIVLIAHVCPPKTI